MKTFKTITEAQKAYTLRDVVIGVEKALIAQGKDASVSRFSPESMHLHGETLESYSTWVQMSGHVFVFNKDTGRVYPVKPDGSLDLAMRYGESQVIEVAGKVDFNWLMQREGLSYNPDYKLFEVLHKTSKPE